MKNIEIIHPYLVSLDATFVQKIYELTLIPFERRVDVGNGSYIKEINKIKNNIKSFITDNMKKLIIISSSNPFDDFFMNENLNGFLKTNRETKVLDKIKYMEINNGEYFIDEISNIEYKYKNSTSDGLFVRTTFLIKSFKDNKRLIYEGNFLYFNNNIGVLFDNYKINEVDRNVKEIFNEFLDPIIGKVNDDNELGCIPIGKFKDLLFLDKNKYNIDKAKYDNLLLKVSYIYEDILKNYSNYNIFTYDKNKIVTKKFDDNKFTYLIAYDDASKKIELEEYDIDTKKYKKYDLILLTDYNCSFSLNSKYSNNILLCISKEIEKIKEKEKDNNRKEVNTDNTDFEQYLIYNGIVNVFLYYYNNNKNVNKSLSIIKDHFSKKDEKFNKILNKFVEDYKAKDPYFIDNPLTTISKLSETFNTNFTNKFDSKRNKKEYNDEYSLEKLMDLDFTDYLISNNESNLIIARYLLIIRKYRMIPLLNRKHIKHNRVEYFTIFKSFINHLLNTEENMEIRVLNKSDCDIVNNFSKNKFELLKINKKDYNDYPITLYKSKFYGDYLIKYNKDYYKFDGYKAIKFENSKNIDDFADLILVFLYKDVNTDIDCYSINKNLDLFMQILNYLEKKV